MFDAALVGALIVLVAVTARRAIRGSPPRRALSFAPIAAVCTAIQLGFHAAATAAPSVLTAAALVLTGWTSFGLWFVWLSRAPASRRPDDDEPGGDGRGGGGPGDGGRPRDGGPGGEGDDPDWDRFEREFADYVKRRRETLTPG